MNDYVPGNGIDETTEPLNDEALDEGEEYISLTSPSLLLPIKFSGMASLWAEIARLPGGQSASLLRRNKVEEIVFAGPYTIVRTYNGLGAVYLITTHSLVCYLNTVQGEIIRSVYHNEIRNEIIKVSILESDKFSALHCFILPFDNVSEQNVSDSKEIFEDLQIEYPGFVEFDSINNRVIVAEGSHDYRIFTLDDYTELIHLTNTEILDIKMTPGALMVVQRPNSNTLKLNFFSDESDGVLNFGIVDDAEIDFVDRYELTVLYKQKGHDVVIYDAGNDQFYKLPSTKNRQSRDFIFLYKARKVLVYQNGTFVVYSFNGDFLFIIKAPQSIDPNPMSVSKSQNYIVATRQFEYERFIFIFDLTNGELVKQEVLDSHIHNGYTITAVGFDDDNLALVLADDIGQVSFW